MKETLQLMFVVFCVVFAAWQTVFVVQAYAMLRSGRYSKVEIPAGPFVLATVCAVMALLLR